MNQVLLSVNKVSNYAAPGFSELAGKFVRSLDLKERSKETYQKGLTAFLQFLRTRGVLTPSREDVLAFKDDLKARGLSPYSVSTYLTAVKRFFSWLESEKIYPNIARDIRGAKKAQGHAKDILTVGQIRRLLDSIDRSDVAGLRDYTLINLLLRTGLRTIEIHRANIGDIGTEGTEIVLRIQGKGRDSKDAFVVLTDGAYSPLADYLGVRGAERGDSPLFLSHSDRSHGKRLSLRGIRSIIEARLRGAGLKTERISAHSFRHSTATLALSNGADVVSVRDMLRHANINTTMIYVRNLKRLINAAEKFVDF